MAGADGVALNDSGGTLLLWLFLFIVAPRVRRAITARRHVLGRRRARRMQRCSPAAMVRAERQRQWCAAAERVLSGALWRYQATRMIADYLPGHLGQAELAFLFVYCLAIGVAVHAHETPAEPAPSVSPSPTPRTSKQAGWSRPTIWKRGAGAHAAGPSEPREIVVGPSHHNGGEVSTQGTTAASEHPLPSTQPTGPSLPVLPSMEFDACAATPFLEAPPRHGPAWHLRMHCRKCTSIN